MKVAEMIKQTRIESNLTQEEYGSKFGVSRQTVSSWENERSLPDLQMLIDICNTYHVSLDKLLNEDKEFVGRIDYYSRFKKVIKKIAVFLIIILLLFAGIFIRWEFIANNMNETFSDNAQQMGFVYENGVYILNDAGISFLLPNQKLPFLKEDFFVKNSYADFKIDDIEIGIDIYDGDSFRIEFDHYRAITGRIDKNGVFIVEKNTLSDEEKQIYNDNAAKIEDVKQRLLKIHRIVYS